MTVQTVSKTREAKEAVAMVSGREVRRSDVLRVLAEVDDLGRLAFLSRYGYREAVRFHLRHDGRSYPSKAVLGVAVGLGPSELFGGIRGAAGVLGRLGFHVRDSLTGEILDPTLDGLRRRLLREGLDVGEAPWPELPVCPSAYFASGSNRPAEIRGLARAGADVGVAAPEISGPAEEELRALAGADVLLFVDSGAFSEVRFGPQGAEVVRPMTDASWARVLGLYRRLSSALGSSVWVVAPDRVGCQVETLARLRRYAPEVRELRELGARVLVAVQRGGMSGVQFAEAVDEALSFCDWIPALPCKKAATSPDEVRAFLRDRRPVHVHLLGLGIRNRRLSDYLAPFAEAGCGASVSLDSCWIAANAGRGSSPRRYTRARDAARLVAPKRAAELAVYTCFAGGGLYARDEAQPTTMGE